MNQFLVILINQTSGSEANRLSNLIQSLDHPAVDRVFECVLGSEYPCPYPIESVTRIPVVKFMLKRGPNSYQEVAEMAYGITDDNVRKQLDTLALKDFPDLTGQGGDGIFPSNTNPGGPVFNPLGLFDLPINPPGWVWLVIAGLAAYKASKSKTSVGLYAWGLSSVVAGINFIGSKRIDSTI